MFIHLITKTKCLSIQIPPLCYANTDTILQFYFKLERYETRFILSKLTLYAENRMQFNLLKVKGK